MTKYPEGKLDETDEGELDIKVYNHDEDTIVIDFGKNLSWIGMNREQAQIFALNILRRAADKYRVVDLPNPPDVGKDN
jgi:hypothetical protein